MFCGASASIPQSFWVVSDDFRCTCRLFATLRACLHIPSTSVWRASLVCLCATLHFWQVSPALVICLLSSVRVRHARMASKLGWDCQMCSICGLYKYFCVNSVFAIQLFYCYKVACWYDDIIYYGNHLVFFIACHVMTQCQCLIILMLIASEALRSTD